MPSRRTIRTVTAGVLAAGVATLTACSGAEPDRGYTAGLTKPVTISVDSASLEQMVLGEIYQQVLLGQGREANVQVETGVNSPSRIDRLLSGEADLVIGCTGSFLADLDPARAREVSEAYLGGDAHPNTGEFVDLTYSEFVGSLPGSLATTDPSSAQGCAEDEVPTMPQNIVPVFDRELFDREETEEIYLVTRAVTPAELEELIEEADKESSVASVVEEWLDL